MLASNHRKRRKRVALAGFGTVGGGVYERLQARPADYEVVGIVCRNPDRHSAAGAPAALLTRHAARLPSHDILVEAIGGLTAAGEIVLGALSRGVDVVTANKSLVSRRFDEIDEAANMSGARVFYSAAVGGGAPMLEAVDEITAKAEIARLDAVLNGTTNFVLERLADGLPLDAAISEAQVAGFAEADPSADLSGVDAAEKLSLLVRRAHGVAIDPAEIPTDPLESLAPEKVIAAARSGAPYKQIATAVRTAGRMRVEVRLAQVESNSPLAKPRFEENCLIIATASGETHIVAGKGAGRDPTADSAFSDIERIFRPGASRAQRADEFDASC